MLEEWQRCSGWLQEALDHAGNLFSLQDVWQAVVSGNAVFLPGIDAAVVVEVRVYPQKRVMNCWLAGGRLEELEEVFAPMIRYYAKKFECELIMIQGRPGWKRVFNMQQCGVVLVEKVQS